ncbi:MAG: bifunctional (p)ppGpp synthetase/guanosine-3',5'-bis(diphosphate) 3'-pyrophosphohydrolase [Flavobacteriales bacterium]|nr:bifunctional (p)ppGpp synthetase/guanosine-3',5'-bis(diphosphate) 3'-pyrophosphohydrolase [Flavobacteriales bacterium]
MSEEVINTAEELEKKEILKRYRQLLKSAKRVKGKEDRKLIREAFELSVEYHKNMRRKSGEPYIYHPLAVAQIAAEEIGLGATSIACALMHDLVEDTELDLKYITKKFGKSIASIIDGLTKISGVFDEKNSPQAENFRKMLLTLSDDIRVILIKICDRLHNMRTLEYMSRNSQLKIASETLYLYAPLAHRLGIYAIKTEMEDLALKYTEPESYREISKKLSQTKEDRDRFIRSFIRPIKTELSKIGLKFVIKGRPKSIYSIYSKMKKQQVSFEQVYDLFAVRIILESEVEQEKRDCWNAYSVVTSIYKPNTERLRDWVSSPKSNGYESLHITVMGPKGRFVEVQIRTRRMDDIAERGYAAHWKYKENSNEVSNYDNWLNNIREMLENPESNALDFVEEFHTNFLSEEVFVFTPKGELKKLPVKATALDFAFEIHTAIGSTCIGAKVNNRIVPLSHVLNNGDQVEILTSAKQKPNKDWLNYVVTGKAKHGIKSFLKEEKRMAAEMGKEILAKKFKNEKTEFGKDNIQLVSNYFNAPSELDLYYMIAKETIAKKDLKIRQIINESQLLQREHMVQSMKSSSEHKNKLENLRKEHIIIGDDNVKLDFSMAKCCSPIPGDEIIGFITIGEGIKIHRSNCKNAIALMSQYSYRVINSRWASEKPVEPETYETLIKITGIDDIGIVSKITDVISKDLKVNMKTIKFESFDGTFEGTLTVFINDTSHLNDLISAIKSIDPYINVTRQSVD